MRTSYRHPFVAVPSRIVVLAFLVLLASWSAGFAGERLKVTVRSSLDGVDQPCYVILPAAWSSAGPPVPLLVSLHSWSFDAEQRRQRLEQLADERGWIYLFPNFRGRNDHFDACGSQKAQQDILDAIGWVQEQYPIDDRRIYLTGVSGGGHMTMLMVARHPDVWAAASAWVGISDLAAWYEHTPLERYRAMMKQVFGGPPGASAAIDREYRVRSPMTHLHRAVSVPLDLSAGIHDGHEGSVSIRHSLLAYNLVARAAGGIPVSDAEIDQLSQADGGLAQPAPSDRVTDEALGRAIHLRRQTKSVRVTIFEGGHEGIDEAAIDWLARHQRAP